MKNILFILSILFIKVSFSQAPEIEWQNTIGGSGEDQLMSIQQTTDGGYIAGGWSESEISGNKTDNDVGSNEYWVMKLDSTGEIVWQNSIGGSETEILFSVKQTADGGYILGGQSTSNISGDKTEDAVGPVNHSDYWVVKLDSTGEIVWQNTIGGNYEDILKSIEQTSDGGYILGGASTSTKTGDKTEGCRGLYDYWVVKLDSLGNIQWQNTIGGSDYDYLESVKQTTDGNYILGGYSYSSISGDKTETSSLADYWVIKLDMEGDILWQKTIGGPTYDFLYSIEQTTDGGYIAGGFSDSNIGVDKIENNNGGYDYWVVKLNSLGEIVWQNTIGGIGYDKLYSLNQTSDGGYILGGYSSSGISGDKTEENLGVESDFWVVKLNSLGNIQWQNTIGGNNADLLYSISLTSDGGFILGGYSKSGISGDKTEDNIGYSDYWVVKLYPEIIPPCSTPPSGLYADFLSSTTAKLHWSADPDAIKYKVQYRKSMVPSWTTTNATSNYKNLFMLEPSTTYKYRVRTLCGLDVSNWSSVATFTTSPLKEMQDKQAEINIYPNPATNNLIVEYSSNDEATIEIINMEGKIIYNAPLPTQHSQIDISKYASGIYLLKIITDEGEAGEKFIKE